MHRLVLFLALVILSPVAPAAVKCVGQIPADAIDTVGETIGGIGSAIEPLGNGRFAMLSDRGAGDGTMDYRPRILIFSTKESSRKLDFHLQETILLQNPEGKPFSGLFPDSSNKVFPLHKSGRWSIDPEGLAIAENGHFFVSEEYGPAILEFSAKGQLIRRFTTPEECIPRSANGIDFGSSDPDHIIHGRQPNRGFEGLTLSPDGKSLITILQSGLTQDGGREAGATRMFIFDRASGSATSSHIVRFADVDALNRDTPKGKKIKPRHLVFSSLTALPDGRILGLERENFGADGTGQHKVARYKALVLLDLEGADNVLGKPLTNSAKAVQRTLLYNLIEEKDGDLFMPRESVPAKWEGIALISMEGNKASLLMSADNDFLNPELIVDRDGLTKIPFKKVVEPQPTTVIRLDITIPRKTPINSNRNP